MFKYIGGKYTIGKWIYSNMPKIKWEKYTEVFGGAMWVYLKNDISAKDIFYNDINPFLYNLWFCMVNYREELKIVMDRIPIDELNNKERFYLYRNIIQNDVVIEPPDFRMALFMIYVITHSFSGNIVNCGCGFPKSASAGSWITFRKKLDDPAYHSKLDKIQVTNLDFSDVIDMNDVEGGFFYVDPPYWELEHLYYTKSFPKEKHFTLADKLHNCTSNWILSYYRYDDLENMYPRTDYIWLSKEFAKSAMYIPNQKEKAKEEELIIFPKSLEEIKIKRISTFF